MKEQMHSLVSILEKSQWHPNEKKLKQHARDVIQHAYKTVPFYQKQYAKHIEDILNNRIEIHELPILTREKLQSTPRNEALSQNIPSLHGSLHTDVTSGSTGVPVEVIGTDFAQLFYNALMLREHTWHKRDFTKKLMAIRWAKRGFGEAPEGYVQDSWGPPINQYKKTGPAIFINAASAIQDQIDAILRYEPNYINSYPSQLIALAEYCIKHQLSFSFLEALKTTGELFSKSYIDIIRKAVTLRQACVKKYF